MKKKYLIPLVAVVALGGFAAYTFAMPHKTVKEKLNGNLYILQKQFTINLQGGQYASLTVALLLPPTQSLGVTSPTNPPPTGFGTLTDEAAIRAIITNDVTDQPASSLITPSGRTQLLARLLHDINSQTDTQVTRVYFTDLAVQ